MLRVRLLGEMDVELDGTRVPSQVSLRPWALCAYLALAPRPLSRAELAARFWPDVLDASSRASLRSALWALRRQLGDHLAVGREHIGLRSDPAPWIDVREFERLVGSGELQPALELCRGELLQGLEDDWALTARERHRESVLALLEQRAVSCEQSGQQHEALGWTRRQVDLDPLDELAHRRLIVRLDAAGDRAGALRAYQAIAQRLRTQLGVAPSARTRELIERVRADPAPAPAPPRPGGQRAPGALPLVGRHAELAGLLGAWQQATGGFGTAAVLRGEAGIGKTRLATELRARAVSTGGQAAGCAALDLGGVAPLSLWAELIRELLPDLQAPPPETAWPDDLAVLANELPTHFGRAGRPIPSVAPELQRTRLFEAVVALLAWATRDRPLLLVLEDIHTADRPSIELAAYAARRAAELPVMLLFTRRELPHSSASDALEHALRARDLLSVEIDLGPLPDSSMAALARSAARLNDAQIDQVVQRSEGNALLAVETARSLARRGDDVAPNLRASVRTRLAGLRAEVRDLIELAAVAGRAVEPLELEAFRLPHDLIVDEALEAGLFIDGKRGVGFRHALLREAAYAGLSEPRARALHQRWAEILLACERTGGVRRPAEAARHFLLAGRNGPAVRELGRSAADARAVGALDQAAAFLEEALAIDGNQSALLLELGEVEAWRARREPAEAAFLRARESLAGGPPLSLARAWLRRARAYHGPLCVPREVLTSSRAALELLDGERQPAIEERREALASSAWAEAVAGNLEQAEHLLGVIESGGLGDDLNTYDVGHARAYALMRRGRFEESWMPSVEAAEAAVRAGRPDLAYGCWAAAAGAAAAAGGFERALELIDRGRLTLKDKGLASIEVHMLAARSFLLSRMGLLTEARTATEVEQRLAADLNQPALIAMAGHDRGLVALESGEHELAAELLGAALVVEGAPVSRPLTRLSLAEALARAGRIEAAAEELRATVLEPLRPSDFPDALVPRLARVQGLIAAAAGDRELAQQRLQESITGWERLVKRPGGAESMTAVLADLGRPVVGLVEPERELKRARRDLAALDLPAENESPHAIVS